eukprot:Gb_16317 [translate_table: standard]
MIQKQQSNSWTSVLLWILLLYQLKALYGINHSSHVVPVPNPVTLNIGVLLDVNSTIGKAAKPALQLAVEHINGDQSIMNSIKLNLQWADSNCSVLKGAAAAMELLNTKVIAIAGPQASLVSRFVAHLASATRVPLVSFAATDPAMAEFQYPYFTRVLPSDSSQMAAIAGIIGYYGWREVIALFTDDDYGRNPIDYLHDALEKYGSKLTYKVAFDPQIDEKGIGSILTQLSQMESRVFVVHMQPGVARVLFSTAYYLRMLSSGYVWIVTDSIANILDAIYLDNDDFLKATQGVIGTRGFIPESLKVKNFRSEWKNIVGHSNSKDAQMTAYAFYAYDSLWMIAHAIDKFLRNGGNVSFVDPTIPADAGGQFDMAKLKVFEGGDLLLRQILEIEFTGLTGYVKLDAFGDRLNSTFEIVNMSGKGLRVVGYWTNETGCTSLAAIQGIMGPLQESVTAATDEQHLEDVIWPGGRSSTPRGWVIPKNGKPLVIGVPHKIGYEEFVSTIVDANNLTVFRGFCIDVFEAAVSYLPYAVPYNFVSYGNGTPNYDALVEKVANKEFDAVVGDIAITTKRAKIVDFTQPYTTSGLVVVVPVQSVSSNHAWAFMKPFTPTMWVITGAFFLFTGLVLWMLEHKKNHDFRGRPKKQFVTTLWFIFSTLFFAHREDVKSTLGRAVLIIWLFVVLIINSSYTASLTSMLTVQQLRPTIQGIAGLISSDVPIGYQAGTFVEEYLMQLGVPSERLVPLSTLASYGVELSKGTKGSGVGAIVDELPYVQVFLSAECDFTISGQQFTKSGWGFAFSKGSQLAIDMSTAILTLSENGELQRIHDTWLTTSQCTSYLKMESEILGLTAFWGLFLITGLVSIFCVVVYYIRMFCQYQHGRSFPPETTATQSNSSSQSRGASALQSFRKFASFVEKAETPRDLRQSFKKRSREEVVTDSNPGQRCDAIVLLNPQPCETRNKGHAKQTEIDGLVGESREITEYSFKGTDSVVDGIFCHGNDDSVALILSPHNCDDKDCIKSMHSFILMPHHHSENKDGDTSGHNLDTCTVSSSGL